VSLSQSEAHELVQKVLGLSKADETFVSVEGGPYSHLRFANNEVTTSGEVQNVVVTVRTSLGTRSGSAQTNQFDAASLERAVRQAEETARFAPEDPEHMTLLSPQQYGEINAWDEAVARMEPSYRADVAKRAIAAAKSRNTIIAGFFTNAARFQAVGNSNGLFGYHRQTYLTYSNTARTPDGTGSGWAGNNDEDLQGFDTAAMARVAVEKGVRSMKPRELAPGTYTVVLEPSAVADLLLFMGFSMDARSADEGRNFFAMKGGGTKIGQQVLNPRIRIYSDPTDPRAPAVPFASEGLPTRKINWVDQGVLKMLDYSRYWAQKQGKEPTPDPGNIIMDGGTGTTEDLVKQTRRGVLVTRIWYIRFVDPQTILLTGLTRDGTFLIENGRISAPVKNFRWNDSPISVFNKVEAMSRAMRARGSESEDFPVVCPAVKTQFTFSSLSEAV
jgi:predicted Zn-dependent protease